MTAPGDETTIASAMRHALSLAAHGPVHGVNPQVGCVILSADGRMLAEGWHRGVGTAHAEVDALSKLTPQQTRGATAVVTLEPCNHVGHTGPCSQALIDAGIATVHYGATDPGPVSGGGAERLRQAGVTLSNALTSKYTPPNRARRYAGRNELFTSIVPSRSRSINIRPFSSTCAG